MKIWETIKRGPPKLHNKFFLTLRWIARVLGSLVVLFLILMALAYAIEEGAEGLPGIRVSAAIIIWIIGVALSWRWEGIGGGIILLNTVIFFILVPKVFSSLSPYHLFLVVGILFLICRWKARTAG